MVKPTQEKQEFLVQFCNFVVMFSVYVVWLSVLSLNILKLHITFRQEILIILLIPGLAFTGSEYQYLGSGQLEPLTWLFDTGQWVPV